MRIGSPQEFRRTMTDWLSATWEASWRPFQYFKLYRLILAGVVLLAGLLPEGWVASLHLGDLALHAGSAALSGRGRRRLPWPRSTGSAASISSFRSR